MKIVLGLLLPIIMTMHVDRTAEKILEVNLTKFTIKLIVTEAKLVVILITN